MPDNTTNFPELLDERTHKMGYYGFKPEKKYGKQGFCDVCHKNFILKVAFNDKFIYPEKTVWVGACPYCRSTIRMVDKMRPAKPLGGTITKVTKTPEGDHSVTRNHAYKWGLKAILGLRKYYKNQIRCTFWANGDNMMDDGLEGKRFYEYENEYYEYAVITMIREILASPVLSKYWWMTVEEIKADIGRSETMKKQFVFAIRALTSALIRYEEDNWDAFFGPAACLRATEEPGFKPHICNIGEISEWVRAHEKAITTFKTTRMPTEYETDDVLADAALEAEIDTIDHGIVKEDEVEVFDKSIDELEYGVDEIPDV